MVNECSGPFCDEKPQNVGLKSPLCWVVTGSLQCLLPLILCSCDLLYTDSPQAGKFEGNLVTSNYLGIGLETSSLNGNTFFHETSLVKDRMESSFFSWNGDDYLAVGVRQDSHGVGVEFYRIRYSAETWQINSLELVSTMSSDIGLISCLVDSSSVYVVGSTDWGAPNKVKIVKTTDLVHFSEVGTIVDSKDGTKFYNSSIRKSGTDYLLALEISAPHLGFRDFSVEFFTSTDLATWTRVGEVFKPAIYAACPFLVSTTSGFYVEWLSLDYVDDKVVFFPRLSRTKDFAIFEDSKNLFLDTISMGNGINMSDLDMIYTHGRVLIAYAEGNQSSGADAYTNIRFLSVPSGMDEFLGSYF